MKRLSQMAKIKWKTNEELEKDKEELEKLKCLPNVSERISALESVIVSLLSESQQ